MALGTALYSGPTPAPEAIAQLKEILRAEPENGALEAALTALLAGLHAMRGDEARARELWARSRALSEELGQRFRGAGIALFAADLELLAGHPEEAAALLRWSVERLREIGVASTMSTHAAVLSEVLGTLGDFDDADAFASLSEQHAASDDVISQAFWRMGRARALAGTGRTDEAERIARAATELAESTDAPDLKARALLTLAAVTGDEEPVARARRLYLEKGNIVAAERLAGAPAPP